MNGPVDISYHDRANSEHTLDHAQQSSEYTLDHAQQSSGHAHDHAQHSSEHSSFEFETVVQNSPEPIRLSGVEITSEDMEVIIHEEDANHSVEMLNDQSNSDRKISVDSGQCGISELFSDVQELTDSEIDDIGEVTHKYAIINYTLLIK